MAEAFISWSGQEARTIAERIRPLFKKVLPNPTLFVASEDLKAGDVWFTKIEPANRNALAHHYTHKPITNSLAREAMTNAIKRRVLTVAPTPEPAQPAGSDEDSEV